VKLLFLDIDGVLNSTRSVLAKTGKQYRTHTQNSAIDVLAAKFSELPYGVQYSIETVDPVAVGLMCRMISNDRDLRIVLSSSHRGFFCGMDFGNIQFAGPRHLDLLKTYLTALGLPGQRLVGITERLNGRRGLEVREYLDRFDGITAHCAVDDGNDFNKEDCNLVLTDASEGFSSKNFFELVKILRIHESQIIF
jgi:hypothetical protein